MTRNWAAEIGNAFGCALTSLESFSFRHWFPPGIAVVAAGFEGPALVDVAGKANVAISCEAKAETPFYIASQTKAFVGLLAAALDAEGTLPLGLTLSAI